MGHTLKSWGISHFWYIRLRFRQQFSQAQNTAKETGMEKKQRKKAESRGWFSWMWTGGSDVDDEDDVIDTTITVPKQCMNSCCMSRNPVSYACLLQLIVDISIITSRLFVFCLSPAASGHWLDDLTPEERNELFKGVGYVENINSESAPDVSDPKLWHHYFTDNNIIFLALKLISLYTFKI